MATRARASVGAGTRARRTRASARGAKAVVASTAAAAAALACALAATATTVAATATACFQNVRYVKVYTREHEHISLTEVEVFDENWRNVAAGRPRSAFWATMGWWHGTRDPERLTDGDVDSMVHTEKGPGEFGLDLGRPVCARKVVFYNNKHSFARDRIKGVDIKLLNGQGREIFHDSISPEEYNANVEKYIVSVNPPRQSLEPAGGAGSWGLGGNWQGTAISGTYAVVGAPGKSSAGKHRHGAAYVFKIQDDGGWNYHATLVRGNHLASNNACGTSVVMHDDWLWIGCPQTTGNGFIEVYRLNAGNYQYTQRLGGQGVAGWEFGVSMGLNSLYGVVGSTSGRFWIYWWNGSHWERRRVHSPGGSFGARVAVSPVSERHLWSWFVIGDKGNTLRFYNLFCDSPTCYSTGEVDVGRGDGALAMYGDFALARFQGKVLAYRRECAMYTCTWQSNKRYREQPYRLYGDKITSNWGFGASISLTADPQNTNNLVAVIGSPGEANGRGRAYVYQFSRNTGAWTSHGIFETIAGVGNKFGSSVSTDGSKVLVGSPGEARAWAGSIVEAYQPAIRVVVGDTSKRIGQYAHNFNIKVHHSSCADPRDCFKSYDGNGDRRLRCEAYVEDTSVQCSSHADNLPCMSWNNFYPSVLPLAQRNGHLVPGNYKIRYKCFYSNSAGSPIPHTIVEGTAHEFTILRGCDAILQTGTGDAEFDNIVKHFYLTSDVFNSASCDEEHLYNLKETLFRKYDDNPMDGSLSFDELSAAFTSHGTDSYVLGRWDSFKSGLVVPMGHFMRSDVLPLRCRSGSSSTTLQFSKSDGAIVYPTAATDAHTCSSNAQEMHAAWDFNVKAALGDFVCVYVDGILFEKLDVLLKPSSNPPSNYISNGNLLLPTTTTDVRPLTGGFLDDHAALVASFDFDSAFNETDFTSGAPLVRGQSRRPLLRRVGMRRRIELCTEGHGALCLKHAATSGTPSPYIYEGDALPDDFAMSFWVRGHCSAANSEHISLVEFKGVENSIEYTMSLKLSKANAQGHMTLRVDHEKISKIGSEQTKITKTLVLTDQLQCGSWNLVGFSLNALEGLTLFANPSRNSLNTEFKSDKAWPTGATSLLTKDIRMFDALHVEFDDVRVYTGRVKKETFIDTFRCGHFAYCASRAYARPSSRRIVCVEGRFETQNISVACAATMYYDGSAIDFNAALGESGVTFIFRDTAVDERAFEILRRDAQAGVGAEMQPFETVVLMEGGLSGCAAVFNSLTYIDRDAGRDPYATWNYAVRTKLNGREVVMSSTHVFVTPWMAKLEGKVSVGDSTTGVPRVRVCADFKLDEQTDARIGSLLGSMATNIAINRRVSHSSTAASTRTPYVLTDGMIGPSPNAVSSAIRSGEYLRIDLGKWSSIKEVYVCDGLQDVHAFQVFVRDEDPKNSPNYGGECLYSFPSDYNGHKCVAFTCRGTNVPSYRGQYVTVIARRDARVSEILVLGSETYCPFSDITDADGSYSITLIDKAGRGIAKKNAKLQAGAYKEEVFAEESITLVSSESRVSMVALMLTQDSSASLRVPTTGIEGKLNKGELLSHVERTSGFHAHGKAFISDETWRSLDGNGDGFVEAREINTNSLAIHPWLIYPHVNVGEISRGEEISQTGVPQCQGLFFYNSDAPSMNGTSVLRAYELYRKRAFNPASARYVRVGRAENDQMHLSFAELEVYDESGRNIARELSPNALSVGRAGTYDGSGVEKLIDGSAQTLVQTYYRYDNYVQLDFGTNRNIIKVVIKNAAHPFYGIRMKDLHITLLDADGRTKVRHAVISEDDYKRNKLEYTFATEKQASCALGPSDQRERRNGLRLNEDDKLFGIPIVAIDPHNLRHDGQGNLPPYASLTGTSNARFQVFAKRRDNDIVHFFSKEDDSKSQANSSSVKSTGELPKQPKNAQPLIEGMQAESVEISHLLGAEYIFPDRTTVPLRGAVMFPSSRVAGSTQCGLSKATITVEDVHGDAEPLTYTTDETGWFDIGLTIGKTYRISVSFANHEICYSGDTIASATDTWRCSGGESFTTIRNVRQATYAFFTDVTRVKIDLGLYQGECESTYSDATYKVEPVNGCHSPVFVTDEQIRGQWTPLPTSDAGDGAETTTTVPRNARFWGFAALDYSISLWSAPPVSGVPANMARSEYAQKYANAECKTEPGDVMQYFRSRDTLQRIAPMQLNDELYSVRFKYHGFVCAEIVRIPKIGSETEMCYHTNPPQDGLKSVHFIGETGSTPGFTVKKMKNINVKVFELHATGVQLSECLTLPSASTESGKTALRLRQTVANPEINECHPRRGGGSSCDFDVEIDPSTKYVKFPSSPNVVKTDYELEYGVPNLAGAHRRSIEVTVDRNDGARVVSVTVKREQINLGAKPRGGEGGSSGTFWATAPLNGFVYTVVHDPPGGESYAELQAGVELSVGFDLTNSGASGSGVGGSFKFGEGFDNGIGISWEAGSGYANFGLDTQLLDVGVVTGFEDGRTGPDVTMSASNSSGWDLTLTMDRTLRTSSDAAIPGRLGDVIMGGGVDISYTVSDVLDLIQRDPSTWCLAVRPVITWQPSKPTTYIFNVHAVEAQVLPNLNFLLSAVRQGAVNGTQLPPGSDCTNGCNHAAIWRDYLMGRITTWTRVISSSSPAEGSAQYDRLATPFLDEHSAFMRQIQNEGGLRNQLDDKSEVWYKKNGPVKDVIEHWENATSSPVDDTRLTAIRYFGRASALLVQPAEWVKTRSANDGEISNIDDGLDEGLLYSLSSTVTSGSARAMASFTGEQANGENIMLTFSGGGHATEYTFHSRENLGGEDMSYSATVDASMYDDRFFDGEFALAGVAIQVETHKQENAKRELGVERAFSWAKYANMNVRYVLGDANFGDKFVVSVSSDRRYGSPMFRTIGGRSKCPGELNTVFRESGIKLEVTGVKTLRLNPNDKALFQVKIRNESPYRESAHVGVRISDGYTESIRKVVDAAFSFAQAHPANRNGVVQTVKSVRAGVIAKQALDGLETAAVRAAAITANEAIDVAIAVSDEASAMGVGGDGKETSDMKFTIGSRPFASMHEIVHIPLLAGDSLHVQRRVLESTFTLSAERGLLQATRFIQMSVVSACEAEMELEMYRPILEDTYPLGPMGWSNFCPKVLFDQTTVARYLTHSVSGVGPQTLRINVINPDAGNLWPGGRARSDLVNSNLAKVRLQYRPVKGGEWISAKDESSPRDDSFRKNLLCPNSRLDGCRFDWDVSNNYEKLTSGFKDDVYELRVKTFCSNGDAFADTLVHEYVSDQTLQLRVDTKPPLQMLTWSGEDSFAVHFSEELDCDRQEVKVWNVDPGCPKERVSPEALTKYTFACPKTSGRVGWVASFPKEVDGKRLSGRYRVDVSGVTDIAGNPANDFSFTADVRREPGAPSRCASPSLGETRRASESNAPSRASTASSTDATAVIGGLLAATSAFALVVAFARRVRAADASDASHASHASTKLTRGDATSYGATL